MSLEVQIKKCFHDFALDVTFTNQNQCMGILGASGCGKSMTLKCIAGIEKPDEGRIVLNERVLFDSEKGINLRPQERKVGYLFQNYALFPTMTVEENIGIGIQMKKSRKNNKAELVQEQIVKFQLEGLEKRFPMQLSGGQQQRAALARMLVCEPEMIMMDEPFSALDGFLKDVLQQEVLDLIRGYQKDVLLVSHSRDEIFKFCDYMTILSQGKEILSGETKQIFHSPKKMEAARLTGCKNISPARKINDYEVFAAGWNMYLKTVQKVEEEIRYVGIRGHRLIPATDTSQENTMKIKMTGYSEAPFEDQYLFQNVEGEGNTDIWWMVKKEEFISEQKREFPAYMILPARQLMLLT